MTDVRQLILEKAQLGRSGGDHFAVLGVGRQATPQQVQAAYFKLVKVLHPDRLARHGVEDLREQAVLAFKLVSDAYNTLSDPGRRAEYENKQSGPAIVSPHGRYTPRGAAPPAANDAEQGRILFHKGSLLLKKGAVAQAESFFQRAHKADPENARYQLSYGWAIFLNEQRPDNIRLAEARRHIEAALRGDEENAEAHYYMARYWKAMSRTDEARKHLEQAVELRENYIEAQRELRLLNMRESKSKVRTKKKTPSGRGPFGLDKLFGKKK